jgi:curli biogenesis system outer membrane secretion channel CsgG
VAPRSVPIVVTGAFVAVMGCPQADARPAADPPAQASERPCLPGRGLVVAMTVRRNLKNGSEVTEQLGNGGYRR